MSIGEIIKEKTKGIRVAFGATIVIILAAGCVILFYNGPQCSNDANYLLSSINQSLASLFAIIFALMFAITQLKKDSPLNDIFTPWVLGYIISFVFAILYPLFLIGSDNIILIKIALFFAIINVSFLIPFFWRFKVKADLQVKARKRKNDRYKFKEI